MKKKLFALSIIALFSCRRAENDLILSPSRHYRLSYGINESQRDKAKYKCVAIKLYTSSGQLLTTLQTGASDYSKWAIGWHAKNDTIILISKDIGNYAFKIHKSEELERISISPELKKSADSIFNKKY